MTAARPDPDALLARINDAEVRAQRGRLKIFFGANAGVGKTCAMLGEAHRRLERGTDVVAAVVESHGRKKVGELIEGIEVIPPQYIFYRGSTFPELDIAAVLHLGESR